MSDPQSVVIDLFAAISARIDTFQQRYEDGRREDINRVADKIERTQAQLRDDLRTQFARVDNQFMLVNKRLDDVCDKGGEEHSGFQTQIDELKAERLRRAGAAEARAQLWQGAKTAGGFLSKHGLPIAAGAVLAFQAFEAFAPNFELEPTAHAEIPAVSAPLDPPREGEDYPLVLRGRD